MRFKKVGIVFLFFLGSIMIIPELNGVVIAASSDFHLDIRYYDEIVHDFLLARYISINGTNITVSGFTFNLNNSWPVANSTENASFPAIWVDMVVGIPYQEYWPILRYEIVRSLESKDLELIFAADYNGSHYREAIITGVATGVWGQSLVTEDNKTGFSYGVCKIIYEENRTVFVGENATSVYNPSLAIYNAMQFMKSRGWNFDNVTNIFLVPNKYLIDEFKTYEFVWTMIFPHNLNTADKMSTELTAFVIAPNGTILNQTHLIMRNAISQNPCGNCSTSSNLPGYMLLVYVGVSGILLSFTIAVLYVTVYKKKKRNENKHIV